MLKINTERRSEMETQTIFCGYNEDGIPVFITVKGTPEAN